MNIINRAKQLTLLGRTSTFYKKILATIKEELPTVATLKPSAQQSLYNSLGIAIIHLPIDLAVDAIEIVVTCSPEYLIFLRKIVKDSKADCEKNRVINSYLLVQNPNRIITLLRIEWTSAQRHQKETIASAIVTFITYHSYFRANPTPLWNIILETIIETITTGKGSTLANDHLKEAETLINQHQKKAEQ